MAFCYLNFEVFSINNVYEVYVIYNVLGMLWWLVYMESYAVEYRIRTFYMWMET